jgi:hypothetical protein
VFASRAAPEPTPTRGRCPRWYALLLACTLGACRAQAADESSACSASGIVGGASDAPYLGLSESQASAVVSVTLILDGSRLNHCSGVLIAPGLALTAAHCTRGEPMFSAELRFGPDASAASALVVTEDREVHPELDLMLLRFDANELDSFAVEPLQPPSGPLPRSVIDTVVALGGYGIDDAFLEGRRSFAMERVVALDDDALIVDGAGLSGACSGDSGGPLLGRGLDGTVRVYGVLNSGSADCRGQDRYARLDRALSWGDLADAAERVAPAEPCGAFDAEGRCFGRVSVFCDGEGLRREPCQEPDVCGYDEARSGYRCIAPAADPCGGVTDSGRCDGHVAEYCDRGAVRRIDCEKCADRCGLSPATGEVACVLDGP